MNEFERVHLVATELKHPIFGFERTNIEPNRASTRFIELLIKLTRNSFFKTSNKLEHVHLLVIELEHLSFGFERTDIKPKRPSLDLLNYLLNRLEHHFI